MKKGKVIPIRKTQSELPAFRDRTELVVAQRSFGLEKVFLLIAVLVGSLLVFLTPPMAVPDENAHFINAYAISTGHFFADTEGGQVGVPMPTAYAQFINNNIAEFGNTKNKQTFTQYYYDSWLKQDLSQQTFYATALRMASPVGYLVSGLGMAVCRLFFHSFALPYNLLLFGRIFNLIFYITVIYLALKITPLFKRTMLLLALMPMSIFLAASLSYDAIIIPVSFLLFACSIKLVTAPDGYVISKKDIAAVLVIAFFLGGIKPVYLTFFLLFLAVPRQRFGTTKRYIICIASVLLVALAAYVIPVIAGQIATRGVVLTTTKYETQQKVYLFSHLGQVPSILINSFGHFYLFYVGGFFGILGLLDTNFPLPVIFIFYLILLIVALFDAFEAGAVKWFAKVMSACGALIAILMIFYAMYIGWTAFPEILGVGASYVSGVQGRYFIPITLFVCFLFSNSLLQKYPVKFLPAIREKVNVVVVFTPAVLGLLTLMTILLRFWG